MAEAQRGGVQSVARAFELLERITDAGGEVSISHLAETTPMPLPTIHRLLQTLMSLGYVRQLPSRHYALGPALIRFGEAASQQLGAWARPRLAELGEQLRETVNMAVLDGDMATYVAQVPAAHAMRMFTEIGRSVHTHASGVGKALLSQLDDAAAEAIVTRAGMPTPTAATIAAPEALLAELATVRSRGYAVDDGEQEVGVRCFAVPVPGLPSPTAISVSGPVTRVDERFRERAVPALTETARRITAAAALARRSS
ncbi:IclR family transcriptional regulator [Brevibacterium otitidis]|uniref:IclR family transcriptional regulator n=1 Tax=Brevibacterium otitidis TaxID=53364 RepID=A0ABV5X515_9MICO|nr:allantoin degradation transcriptional regulator AllR [Brevibacterium otitidis]